MRTLIAILATLAGSAAIVVGAFQPWYRDRTGAQTPVSDLWSGISPDAASLIWSLFLPMVIAAGLALLGLALRRKLLMALGALLAILVVGLFLNEQLRFEALASQFRPGFWNTAAGTVLLLLGAFAGPRRSPQPE